MGKKFRFGAKSFPDQSFLVVHKDAAGKLTTAVYGSNGEDVALRDAKDRSLKAKEMGLGCSYVVLPREEGEAVSEK